MAKRGRPAKPKAEHLLNGNPSKRSDLKGEKRPKPATLSRPCPDYLDKHSRDAWLHLAPQLVARGVLNDITVFAFEELCAWIGKCRQYRIALNKANSCRGPKNVKDDVQTTPKGYRQSDALYNQLKSASSEVRAWLTLFGIDPANLDRHGMIDDEPVRDEFDAWNHSE